MKSQRPTIALWLDSGDHTLIQKWLGEGHLPELEQFIHAGQSVRLEGLPHSRAEVMQTVAITGVPPEQSGYWGVHHFDPRTYRSSHAGLYDYRAQAPFFALGPERRVAVIDFPQYTFHDAVHGIQVRNWGCHSSMTPTDSRPAELIGELDAAFGAPPMRTHDFSVLQDGKDLQRMIDDLHQGIDQRARLLEMLAAREPWDLFLANIADTHKAGHYLVPNADSLHVLGREDPWGPLRGIHTHVDRVFGPWLNRLRQTANVAVFSYEGVKDYSDEVQNTFLLSDLLVRDSFGGKGAFVYEDPSRGPSPEARAGIINWVMESWHLRRRPNRWQEWVHARWGADAAARIDALLGLAPHPAHPSTITHCEYQPLMWLEKYRPHLRAFALPTFSDGFIRLNVRGREARGRIAPGRFREECDRITALLTDLKDAETGKPAVAHIYRTRDEAFQDGPERPPADLVVQWHRLGSGGGFVSTKLGRFGPAPALRASTHSAEGFFWAAGPDVPAQPPRDGGNILDIAPTLLELAGVRPPQPLPGRSLLREAPAARA